MRLRLALTFLIAVTLLAPLAQAHARPTRMGPEPGAALDTAPTQVWIRFSEPINPRGTRIDVFNETGQRVGHGPAYVVDDDRGVVDLRLNDTDEGYLVRWTTYSILDGHRMAGSWGFAVGNATPPQTGSSVSSPLDFGSVFLRAISYLGLVGVFAFAWASSLFGGATSPVWRLGLVGSVLMASSAFLQLVPQVAAGGFTEDPFVHRLLLQLAQTVAMVAVVGLAPRRRSASTLMVLIAFWAISNGAGSHARAALGELGAALDGVHILLAAAWMGGIAVVLFQREGDDALLQRRALRIGRIATFCLVGLVLTGGGLAASLTFLAGRAPTQLPLTYGIVLLYKLALVATMIGFGVVNRYVHVPRLLTDPTRKKLLDANLRRELINGLLVLVLAAILATLDPETP